MRQDNYVIIQDIVNILEETEQKEINGNIIYEVKENGRHLYFNATTMEFYEKIPVSPYILNRKGEPICKDLLVFKCELDKNNNLKCEVPNNNKLISVHMTLRSFFIKLKTGVNNNGWMD